MFLRMDATAATQADPAALLPRATYYQITHTLRGLLPPPVTDTQEDEARRDLAAIAHVASLLPANADEANLAAQYVAASTHAFDSLRLARQYPDDPTLILKCTAQSASMMREARSWRTALLRAQAARATREADTVATDTATQTERRALALMADGLTPSASSPAPEPAPATERKPDVVAEAERYAVLHRKRATLIRRFGHVPQKLNFGPLSPGLVHAIATGTTPILRALDLK
jgi:hypothetical protein